MDARAESRRPPREAHFPSEHRGGSDSRGGDITRIDAAIVREQGVEFTVVSVKASAVATTRKSHDVIRGLTQYFPGRPIVLAARVGSRVQFVGRRDLVNWLARTKMWRLPWKTYSFRS